MKSEPPKHHRPHDESEQHESLIHHEEPTILEQWLRRGMEKGPAFWAVLGIIAVVVTVAALLLSWLVVPSEESRAAWAALAAANREPESAMLGADTPSNLPERLKEIARSYPDTAASDWARVRAATILLNEGSAELATPRREAGIGKIIEADELFGEVAETARTDALERIAALGQARAAEARLGLSEEDADRTKAAEVIAMYELVAESWPDTPEGERAAELARRLDRPESVAFYDRLASFDPDALPSGSTPSGTSPGVTLDPGASSPLQGLLPPITPMPSEGDTTEGTSGVPLKGLDFSPPTDLTTEPKPQSVPEPTPVPVPVPETIPQPKPSPAPAEPTQPLEPKSETPKATLPDRPFAQPRAPEVPENPFGPRSKDSASSTDASNAPEPTDPSTSPDGSLPENVFPSGRSER